MIQVSLPFYEVYCSLSCSGFCGKILLVFVDKMFRSTLISPATTRMRPHSGIPWAELLWIFRQGLVVSTNHTWTRWTIRSKAIYSKVTGQEDRSIFLLGRYIPFSRQIGLFKSNWRSFELKRNSQYRRRVGEGTAILTQRSLVRMPFVYLNSAAPLNERVLLNYIRF